MYKYLLAQIALPILIISICEANPAAKHAHTHTISKERVEDGAYIAKDHDHFSDDGDHNAEFDHEAILGSVKEAEEFDKLSPEESKRRLSILLVKMDLNNDKQIDRNELHAWILRSFRMLSDEEARERFEDADENGDGKVSWAEYISDTYGLEGDEELPLNALDSRENEQQLIDDDKLMFQAADTDKNNLLDAKEFVVFSHPEEHPIMLPIILQQTLRDKDKNNDGFIDFQEFIDTKGATHDKDWILVEKQKFDHEFDKNKDGLLNGNEILSWVVPSNDEIAEEEVSHLFGSTDDDHDGLLSFREILDHYDIFVGSEATDYGDHLNNIHHFEDEL